MNHDQLGGRRRVRGAVVFVGAPLLAVMIGGPLGPASAGEFDRFPAAPDSAQCDSRNEALGAFKDSGECSRISGYVAAGARFGPDERIGDSPSPFGPLDAPEFVGSLRPSGEAIIDAPAGRNGFFLPPGPADEAR